MAKYVFVGPTTDLGRFGVVKKGDVLDLTGREESHIENDERFEKHDPKKKIEQPEGIEGLNLPDNFKKLPKEKQEEAIAKARKDEQARRERLSQINDKTPVEDINQLSKDDLLQLAHRLKKENKQIEFKEDFSVKQLRRAILSALFGENADKEEGEE